MSFLKKVINFFSRSNGEKDAKRSSSPVMIIRRGKDRGSSPEEKRADLTPKLIFIPLLFILLISPGVAQWQQTNLSGAINGLFYDGTNLFAATNAGVLRSTDDGVNWNGENTGLTTLTARNFTTSGTDIFVVTLSGGIYRSANGPSWNWSLLQSGSFHCLLTAGSTILAGSIGGGIYISNNNGNTWAQSNTGLGNLNVWALYGTGSAIYAGTTGGVFKSTDNGVTWAAANSGISSLDIRGFISAGSTLFAGSIGGGIYRSTDAGASWTFVAGGSVDAFALTCGTDLYAGATNNGGISKSTDNGLTWTGDNSGLTNTSVTAFASTPTHVFAGTFGGVYKKTLSCPVSNCTTWDLFNSGAVTTTAPNQTATAEAIGPGTSAPFMSVFAPYVSTGQRLWVGNTGWVAGARDPNRYIEFNVQATPGNQLTVSQVKFNYGDNTLTTDLNIIQSQVFFSTDGWSTSTQMGGTLNYLNTAMQTFNVTIPGGLVVPIGQQFSVRIFPYAPNGSNPMSPSFAIHNSVQICGESTPYVPPTTTCVTWNLISSQAVSSISGNITATPEVLGLGTSAPFMSVFLPYTVNGQRLWLGNAGWPASNRDHNRYIEFTVSPTPGNNLTVNTVSFFYGDNPGLNNFNILQGEVYYTVNNWSNTFQLGSTFTYLNTVTQTFNQTIPGGVLVPNGGTFKMRIYPWSSVGSNPMTPSFATHRNVTICGETSTAPPDTASICGTKFNDLNGNGVMDPGEPGLPGWQIGLGIATVPYAITDANGDYCFTNLPAGNYTVSEVQQPGWVQTFPASPGTHSITLAAGQHLENVNFGNMRATLNCDSLSATAVRTHPDDCNWVLSLHQPANLPGIASVQVVCLAPNQFTTGTGLGTNYQNWFTSGNNIFTPPSGLVPGGNLNNFFNMSLLFVTSPQFVVVNWIDTLGNIACSDTVELNCQISCTTILEDTVTCNDGNPILKYRFRNDAGFNMKNIQYTVVSPSGVTVNPSNVTLTTPVNPGSISGLQSLLISGASVGDTVRLSVKFTSSDGCCWCYGTIVVIIPDCRTFCDSLGVSATGSPQNCSYNISLVNNSTMVFSNVEFQLVSGGVFTNFTASNTGWGFTNLWPNNTINLVRMPISTGIGNGTYNNILNVSISQYTNPIQTIIVKWIKNGVVMCTDTLQFTCIPTVPPANDCSQLIEQTLTCRPDGSFMFKFRVQNNSNITSTGYGINPTTPGVSFSKTIVNNVSILPGQVSPLDSLIVTGIAPNTSLCFQTAIFTTVVPGDTVYNYCCHSDTLCITTPDCGATDIKDSRIPTQFELLQNFPNPFNPSTTIAFNLPKAGNVKLTVYDPLGREVAVLVDDFRAAGTYRVNFDASALNSGIYFYRIISGEYNQTRKLILLK